MISAREYARPPDCLRWCPLDSAKRSGSLSRRSGHALLSHLGESEKRPPIGMDPQEEKRTPLIMRSVRLIPNRKP